VQVATAATVSDNYPGRLPRAVTITPLGALADGSNHVCRRHKEAALPGLKHVSQSYYRVDIVPAGGEQAANT
jgi:hypothetical protein